MEYAGEISAWLRQADNKACADRIGNVDKYDRDRASLPKQSTRYLGGMREDDFGLTANQLFGDFGCLGPGRRVTDLDAEIVALRPSQFLHFMFEFY